MREVMTLRPEPGVHHFRKAFPERFFQKYPTLRGARVDHPFRSRLPRYTLAQDHPITRRHFREALQGLLRRVPDLSYLSIWTNDRARASSIPRRSTSAAMAGPT